MQVDLSELRAAISIACRLGFASRLPHRRSTGAPRLTLPSPCPEALQGPHLRCC